MKKFATLLLAYCLATTAFGQTPFTITAGNFPVFGIQNYDGPNTPNGNNLIPAPNGNWDLSSYHSGAPITNDYQVETLPFYTSAGVDVYLSGVKVMTPTLGYMMDSEFDFNATGVYDKGIYVPAQAYSLASFTGNALDSLTFPLQGFVYQNGRQVMEFPASYQSGWYSESRRVVDFNLSVAALGLNKTPCKHVFTIFRTDTILGWGKLRVYSNGAASVPYDVLIDRTIQYALDSFFVGGAPAPPALLAAFGITQGQQTGAINRYTVYREGYSMPLSVINFPNTNFSTPTALFFETENLWTTGVENPAAANFSTLVFPNPCSAGELNLQITGEVPALHSYEIIDMEGRTVQSGIVQLDAGLLHTPLNSQIPNGSYLLRVLGDKKQTTISEPFMLMR